MAGYNVFSGRSVDRLQALADGVFAVAMTLLVLDLRLPQHLASTDHALGVQLTQLGPQVAAYALSFSMLGTFWLAEHTLLERVQRSDRTLAWSVLSYLFVVTTLPFTASTLADHVHLRLAVWLYWLSLALLGTCLAWQHHHITRAGLAERDDPALRLIRNRLVLAQAAYAIGALVAIASPVGGVVALAAFQLFFIVSPRLPWQV